MRRRSEAGAPREEAPAKAPLKAKPAPKPDALKIPHDIVNEQVVIAAVCCDKPAADRLLPTILPETFYGKGHADIWAGLRTMQARGLYYDPATLAQVSGGVVDTAYVEQLLRDRPALPPNLGYHVEMLVFDRARVEAVRGPIASLLEALRDTTTDPERLRALAKSVGGSFDGFGGQRYLRATSQLIAEQSIRMTRRRTEQPTYWYGIPGLDLYEDDHSDPKLAGRARFTPGAAPGKITMFTARTGGGKSTMAARCAIAWANMEQRVLFGAWEMGEGPTLELCAALSLGYDRSDLMEGRFTEEDQRDLEREMERLGEWIKFFVLPFGRARGEKQFNDKNLDLVQQVISDSHAQHFVADLIRRALKETNPDDEEQAAFRLQAMAQEQQVHHLWLHQQNIKKLEERADPRPTLEAVKGSAAWVETSDTVIAWHRQALVKNVPDDRLQALVLKQRDGRYPLAVEFDWEPEFGAVSNGRSIDYARPGEDGGIDSFLGETSVAPKPSRGRRRRVA